MATNPPVFLQSNLAPWDSRHLPVQSIPLGDQPRLLVPGQRGARTSAGGFNLFSDSNIVASFDPNHYAELVSVFTPVSSVQSTIVLGQSESLRNFLLMRNTNATANLLIDFGNQASANSPLRLTPGQIVLFDVVVPQNDIYAFADAADTGGLALAYSTIARPAPAPNP